MSKRNEESLQFLRTSAPVVRGTRGATLSDEHLSVPGKEDTFKKELMTHRKVCNQTGYFGRGAIANIPTEISARGLRNAFIVTDPVLAENGTITRITNLLDSADIGWQVFSDVVANPPIEKIQAGLAVFRDSGADVLIGLGGGSPQDTCQAISVIATNPEFEDVLESGIEGLTNDAFADVCTPGNPRPVTREDIEALYRSLL